MSFKFFGKRKLKFFILASPVSCNFFIIIDDNTVFYYNTIKDIYLENYKIEISINTIKIKDPVYFLSKKVSRNIWRNLILKLKDDPSLRLEDDPYCVMRGEVNVYMSSYKFLAKNFTIKEYL